MSPRFALRKPWAKAQSCRTATSQHHYPKWTNRSYTQVTSSSDNQASRHKPRQRKIFSLVQPTGIPHLGNYLGALRTWKDFQNEKKARGGNGRDHTLYYGIADLHSLTLRQDPQERVSNVRKTFASLLAIGLEPSLCTLFVQSHVPMHSELMWILSTVASTGYLSRMTQWKDKIGIEDPESSTKSMESLDEKSQEKLKLALFSYPVLQAADILLYAPDTVPVGEDQAQHVEFTRHLARAFNSAYVPKGSPPILTVPELYLSPAKRIMSLQNPTKKMSKSDPDASSRVLITDDATEIREKFRRAKTDSVTGPITYSRLDRPGVANLIDIYKHVRRIPKAPEQIATDLGDMTLGAFKSLVADAVVSELGDVREKYLDLMNENNPAIDIAMISGRKRAAGRAGKTLLEVRNAVGLESVNRVIRSVVHKQKGNDRIDAEAVDRGGQVT